MDNRSIYRRCGCRDESTGRLLGTRCPGLRPPGHGTWYFSADLPSAGGRRGAVMADLAKGAARTAAKLADLAMALEGRFTGHHAAMCRLPVTRPNPAGHARNNARADPRGPQNDLGETAATARPRISGRAVAPLSPPCTQ